MNEIKLEGFVEATVEEWDGLRGCTMRLDTRPGENVIFAYPGNGMMGEGEGAIEAGLKVNGIYTVRQVDVYASQTDVWLEEYPRRKFNSVLFANTPEQPE